MMENSAEEAMRARFIPVGSAQRPVVTLPEAAPSHWPSLVPARRQPDRHRGVDRITSPTPPPPPHLQGNPTPVTSHRCTKKLEWCYVKFLIG